MRNYQTRTAARIWPCSDAWFRSHSNCSICRASVHEPDSSTANLLSETSKSAEIVITVSSELWTGVSEIRDAGLLRCVAGGQFSGGVVSEKGTGVSGVGCYGGGGFGGEFGFGFARKESLQVCISSNRIWSK